MDPVPRALKLAREAADCHTDCKTLINTLVKYHTNSSFTNAVDRLTIANVEAMIRYGKEHGIHTGENSTPYGVTIDAAAADVVEQAEDLMAMCTNVITRFVTLRDMCNMAKTAIVDKPNIVAAPPIPPEPYSDDAIPYIVAKYPPIDSATTDGAVIVFHWYVGKKREKTGNLIVWDGIKRIYTFNTCGRNARPTSEHRGKGMYSITYLDHEYIINYTATGIVTNCSVKHVAGVSPYYHTAWCEIKPIKWAVEKFYKVFGRDQLVK